MKKSLFAMLVAMVSLSIQSEARVIISTHSVDAGGGCAPGNGWCVVNGMAAPQPGILMGDLAFSPEQGLTITMSKFMDISSQDYLRYFTQAGFVNPGGPASFDPAALASVGYNGPNLFAGPFQYTEVDDVVTIYLTEPVPEN